MAKKKKNNTRREFLESAEELLKDSAVRGEVISTMLLSMSDVSAGDPVDKMLNEVIALLNRRIDYLESALNDLINMHYKCRRAKKHE